MLTEKQLGALLPDVEALARRAGAAILDLYQSGTPVIVKADGSPVTAADHASDSILSPGLANLTPAIPVVSEEGVEAGLEPDISGGSFWLVDPLDGTREFIAGSGQFTVLIGLIENGRPVLGVMYGPVQDELYAAAVPGCAWEAKGGERTAMRVRQPPPDGMTVTTSYAKSGAKLSQYLESQSIRERIVTRSAFKFADIARGSADVYPALGLSYEWDTAAGHALVLAAGGNVTGLDGSPLVYGKAGFKNPDILAFGGR